MAWLVSALERRLVSKIQSSRWQKLGDLDEEAFEARVSSEPHRQKRKPVAIHVEARDSPHRDWRRLFLNFYFNAKFNG
jgi:hypothetical protein